MEGCSKGALKEKEMDMIKKNLKVLSAGPVLALALIFAFPAGAAAQGYQATTDSYTVGNSNCGSQFDFFAEFERTQYTCKAFATWDTSATFFGSNFNVLDLEVLSLYKAGKPPGTTNKVKMKSFGITLVSQNNSTTWAWGQNSVMQNPYYIGYAFPLSFVSTMNLSCKLNSINYSDLTLGVPANDGAGLRGGVFNRLNATVKGKLIFTFFPYKIRYMVKSTFPLYKHRVKMYSTIIYQGPGTAYVRSTRGAMKVIVKMHVAKKVWSWSWLSFGWGPWNQLGSSTLWSWFTPTTTTVLNGPV